MANARVVIDAPCPGCGGNGLVEVDSTGMYRQECSRCHGTGAVQRMVTCAGCLWWTRLKHTESGRCEHHNDFYIDTFGCTRWEARP